jgi:DNA transformation protein and related proteins
MAVSKDFADYCCELLSGVGTPTAKRMFGGWAVYVQGVSLAWLLDMKKDGNSKLYLKASDDTSAQYDAAGCERFVYDMKGVVKSVNYYTAPDEAMESPDAMLPWARLAFSCALEAKAKAKPKAAKSTLKVTAKTPKKAGVKKISAKK